LLTIFITTMAIVLTLIGIVSLFKEVQPEQIISDPVIPVYEVEPIIIDPIVDPDSPEFIYVRIIANALNVRVGPGIRYSLVYRPDGFGKLVFQKGAVCRVKNQRIKSEDGKYWYEIVPKGTRGFSRFPGRVISKWFMAKEYTKKIELKETITVFDDTELYDKRIEIDLSEQMLRAFEKDRLVLETLVSTGLPTREYPDHATPTGNFQIFSKQISTYMQGTEFDLPCIPFVLFFTYLGHAIHGAYWHDEFGIRRSHWCVNVIPDGTDEWLYWWSGDLGETRIIIKE